MNKRGKRQAKTYHILATFSTLKSRMSIVSGLRWIRIVKGSSIVRITTTLPSIWLDMTFDHSTNVHLLLSGEVFSSRTKPEATLIIDTESLTRQLIVWNELLNDIDVSTATEHTGCL